MMRTRSARHSRPATTLALTLATATGLLGLAGCAGQDAEDKPTVRTRQGSSSCKGPRAPEAKDAVEVALAHIDKVAQERFRHVYTGLRVDHDGRALILYRIPDAAFDRVACRGIPENVSVRLRATTASQAELEALKDRIADDMKRWDGEFAIRTIDAAEEGHVMVGVDKPEVAEPLLRKTYGDLVTTEYVDRPQLDRS
ncbi:hypothetical protein ACIBI4_07425 [Streptomyces sp. NPDC050418]|uniref:hypothetical protein n=1 Tax=Streptomyces sp. NPDC050418 TaxID=3365612 RepID=UPI0037AD4AB9